MLPFNSIVKTLIDKPAHMLGDKTEISPVSLRDFLEYVLANRVREQNSRKLQEHLETLRRPESGLRLTG